MLNTNLINHDTEGVLQLIGSLDANSAANAEEEMIAAAEKYNKLTLDMSELEYISSAGLRAIKRAHVAMRRKEGALLVTNVNKTVMDVFEITGFSKVLKFV